MPMNVFPRVPVHLLVCPHWVVSARAATLVASRPLLQYKISRFGDDLDSAGTENVNLHPSLLIMSRGTYLGRFIFYEYSARESASIAFE